MAASCAGRHLFAFPNLAIYRDAGCPVAPLRRKHHRRQPGRQALQNACRRSSRRQSSLPQRVSPAPSRYRCPGVSRRGRASPRYYLTNGMPNASVLICCGRPASAALCAAARLNSRRPSTPLAAVNGNVLCRLRGECCPFRLILWAKQSASAEARSLPAPLAFRRPVPLPRSERPTCRERNAAASPHWGSKHLRMVRACIAVSARLIPITLS